MRSSLQRCAVRADLLWFPWPRFFAARPPGWAGTLGSAQGFGVLGYAGVTSAVTDPASQIYGNVGVTPGALSLITGLSSGEYYRRDETRRGFGRGSGTDRYQRRRSVTWQAWG